MTMQPLRSLTARRFFENVHVSALPSRNALFSSVIVDLVRSADGGGDSASPPPPSPSRRPLAAIVSKCAAGGTAGDLAIPDVENIIVLDNTLHPFWRNINNSNEGCWLQHLREKTPSSTNIFVPPRASLKLKKMTTSAATEQEQSLPAGCFGISPFRPITLKPKTAARTTTLCFDLHSLGRGSAEHGLLQSCMLREKASGIVFAGSSSCAALLGPLPRLGIPQIAFPPPPPVQIASAAASSASSKDTAAKTAASSLLLDRMWQHLTQVRANALRAPLIWDSVSETSVGSKLVLLGGNDQQNDRSPVILLEGRDVIQKVDALCQLLLDAVYHVKNHLKAHQQHPSNSGAGVEHRIVALAKQEWQHCFCRAVDMYLKDCGCVASLVEILNSQEKKNKATGGKSESTPEARVFLSLIEAWSI